MTSTIGLTLAKMVWAFGAGNYILTTLTSFNQGKTELALIQMCVPPAELVLPWVVAPALGVVSAMGAVFVMLGMTINVVSAKSVFVRTRLISLSG